MTLRYDFNDYNDYEYELDYSDISDFFDTISDEDVAEAAEEVFYKLTEAEQEEIINMWEKDDDGTCVTIDEEGKRKLNFNAIVKEDKSWVVSELLFDDLDLFEERMKDHFLDNAYEQYKDAKAYNDDPYSYNGVSRSDFY